LSIFIHPTLTEALWFKCSILLSKLIIRSSARPKLYTKKTKQKTDSMKTHYAYSRH